MTMMAEGFMWGELSDDGSDSDLLDMGDPDRPEYLQLEHQRAAQATPDHGVGEPSAVHGDGGFEGGGGGGVCGGDGGGFCGGGAVALPTASHMAEEYDSTEYADGGCGGDGGDGGGDGGGAGGGGCAGGGAGGGGDGGGGGGDHGVPVVGDDGYNFEAGGWVALRTSADEEDQHGHRGPVEVFSRAQKSF